jgi:hypothetical protein
MSPPPNTGSSDATVSDVPVMLSSKKITEVYCLLPNIANDFASGWRLRPRSGCATSSVSMPGDRWDCTPLQAHLELAAGPAGAGWLAKCNEQAMRRGDLREDESLLRHGRDNEYSVGPGL